MGLFYLPLDTGPIVDRISSSTCKKGNEKITFSRVQSYFPFNKNSGC